MDEIQVISQFNYFDLIALGILFLAGLIGVLMGFTRIVLNLVGWVGAFFATLYVLPHAKSLTYQYIKIPFIADSLTALVVFIIALVLFTSISKAISMKVKASMLGGVDRSLGMLLGIILGALAVVCGFIASVLIWKPCDRPAALQQSRSLPFAAQGVSALNTILPAEYQLPRRITRHFNINPEINNETCKDKKTEELVKKLSTPSPESSSSTPDQEGYQKDQRTDMDRLIETHNQ